MAVLGKPGADREHQGLAEPCLSPLPVCVWMELCESGEFVTTLSAPPATPPPVRWTSIASRDDGIVPVERTELDGAERHVVDGVPHAGEGGLTEDEGVYALVRAALE